MRAVVWDRYGPPDVLHLDDVERPAPRAGEVLVRVRATTVTRSDAAWRGGKPFISRFVTGVRRPKRRILGTEFAGEVAELGEGVTELHVGDRVFGASVFGAHAEFVSVRERGAIVPMPEGMSFEQAAASADGPTLVLNAFRPITVEPGRHVLVYGASGSMGTAAVQLLKHWDAEVTAVTDTRHVELARALGADHVVDYTKEDFLRTGLRYDVIFDAVGKLRFTRCRRALEPGGVYLPTDGWRNLARGLVPFGRKRVRIAIPPRYTREYLLVVKGLIEAGEYRPVVDRTYPLEDVVEATRYVETGQKTGNVVLTVDAAA